MKKIFFAILFLMITGVSLSQTVIPKNTIHLKIPGDGGGSKFSVMIYYNPADGNYYYYNPITQQSAANVLLQDIYNKSDTSLTRLTSMVVKLIEIVDKQNEQITLLNSSNNSYSKIGTSVAALDSIGLFGFTSRHIGINNDETGAITDSTTMYISAESDFDPLMYKIYAGETLSLEYATTKLYFKFGSTPVNNKTYRFIVN